MQLFNKPFILFYFCFVLSCSPIYRVSYDYDRSVNFKKLKAYSWMQVPEKEEINSLDLKRIKDSVDNELKAKGLSINFINPDFLIAQHLIKKDKLNITDRGYSYGLHRRFWGFDDVAVYQYEEGTLILDFIESESKVLIWRGSARTDFENANTPEKRDSLIKEAVRKILHNFPPTTVR